MDADWLLPSWCQVLADKAYNAEAGEASIRAELRVRFVPIRKANKEPNPIDEQVALRTFRKVIESSNS